MHATYAFKVDISVDYICWMHVLTTQSYLNDKPLEVPPSPSEELEKIVFETQSSQMSSKIQGVRQESISWDLRRSSVSSIRNVKGALDLKDAKSKYASPPLSATSSVGVESETKSVASNASSGLAAHLQKRWSTDVPIKPFDKPSEWQTRVIS
jgi:hypothetical protein